MLRSAKNRPTIGVLAGVQVYYGTILGNFIGPLLRGMHSAAENRRCNLLLACGMDSSSYTAAHPAWPVPSPEVDYIPVGPWNTDGLIVVNPLFSEARSRYIQELIAGGHPVVFAATGENGPTVAIDNEDAVHQALLHLMSHGHRQIAFIAGYPNDAAGDSGIRLRAFQRFAREYRLAGDPRLIAYGSHGINGGQQAMGQILESGVSFTAVLASNDESAIGAISALKAAGLRIPEDVAVIGNDDTFDALTLVPPLTTFHSSPFRMGYQALDLLMDFIEGKSSQLESITVPMQLVVRQSCGCQPSLLPQVETGPASAPKDVSLLQAQLTKKVAETALSGTQRLSPGEAQARSANLVAAFFASLRAKDGALFQSALIEILKRVESLGDDIYVWSAGLSVLESSLGQVREALAWPPADPQPERMVAEARAAISLYMERQQRQLTAHHRWIADQVGQMNARLLTALDEAQVYEILAGYVPQVGISHVEVAFLEAEGDDPAGAAGRARPPGDDPAGAAGRARPPGDDPAGAAGRARPPGNDPAGAAGRARPPGNDPAAWCRLRKVSEPAREARFPSRQFPPRGLYPEPYHLALVPMVGGEAAPGFVAFGADDLEICATIAWQLVTFLKVVRLYREATHGRQLAEEANRLKSRFLSTVSHELRTPLSLIVGLSQLMLEEEKKDAAEARQDLKRIHASAQHLDGLIRDVLDLAQNEMGELKLVCAPLDLAEVFQVVTAVGEQLAQGKGLEWRASIPEDLPAVWGDRTRLRQVALNLVNNAVKFTTRGQVTLRVAAGEGSVRIEVSDTGLGILPEEQTFIFDEFRQAERTTLLGYGGLGLGLAICKRLVELHGGSIEVTSSGKEGEGSTFTVSLPAMQPESTQGLPVFLPRERPVLLLAGHVENGERLKAHLTRQGYEVDLAWLDPGEGWLPRWLKTLPGAVVLEQGAALRQGWEVIRALRENPLTRDIPVLVYALDEKQERGAVLELKTLAKPLNKAELVDMLGRWEAGRQADQGAGKRAERILIADDEPGALDLHARLVAAWSPGCKILKARNGREALDILSETRPDLILLDLMMPELDGFGVIEAMRSDPRSRDIPVIVLTGQTLTLEDMEHLGRGVTSVLSKDVFSAQETLSHIESALAHSAALGSEAQRIVRRAMAYLHEHYMEPVSLEDAARYVSVSKEYLARCFRQELGITLVTYLTRYRVKQAKVLLEKGQYPLTEIALETGFSSSSYFSRIFRQETGMSPREYQRSPRQYTARID